MSDLRLSDTPGVGVTVDDLPTPDEVGDRVELLLEAAATFGRRIEIIVTQDGNRLDPRTGRSYRVRSFHEPLTEKDPMVPPAVQR